jgi:hypothetical protein
VANADEVSRRAVANADEVHAVANADEVSRRSYYTIY